MTHRTLLAAAPVAAALALAANADAQVTLDQDDAGNAVYADGWQNFDDGSTQPELLGGWVHGGNAVPGETVDIASSANNGGGTTIDTDGVSFQLWDPPEPGQEVGGFVDTFRFIDPAERNLQVGETFSFDLDVNFRGGFKGVTIRDADDETSLFNFNVGGDDYTVNDVATGGGSVGDAYSNDTVFSIALEQTAADGGTWTVTRSGAIDDVDTGTYTGVVSSFQLYSGDQGSFPEDAIFFNNFLITGEEVAMLPGDANGDGTVDLADFGILRSEFGSSGAMLQADFNDDMTVDLADFGILRANFGSSADLGTLDAWYASVVPEPATLALAGLAGVALLRRR